MPVLDARQMRAWDEYTMQHEPIASIDLMERAAGKCFQWLQHQRFPLKRFAFFCGKGNNGGDGLALARMLSHHGAETSVYILEFGHKGTEDFQINLSRLHQAPVEIKFIQSPDQLPVLDKDVLVIDALLGSGLNRPIEGFTADVVRHINESGNTILSIDIPTGLFADRTSSGNTVVHARHTLTFQCQKPAFLLAENADYVGQVHVLDIGLLPGFLKTIQPAYYLADASLAAEIYQPRKLFSHKGSFGHALIVAGSEGKMGAAVLCTMACLRSGAGLVSVHIPGSGLNILQTAVPEAMCEPDKNERFNQTLKTDLHKYNAIGVGPGLATSELTGDMLEQLFSVHPYPLVLDADALNLIAIRQLQHKIPKNSILTPHPREFERLFGPAENDFERIQKAQAQAVELQLVIVLKGHYTFIATPEGKGYFNSSGNPGMATGGTGDVLTGLITGLMAQKYSPVNAAVFGVYWHGAAGDLAAIELSQESMIASDVIGRLGRVILTRIHSNLL